MTNEGSGISGTENEGPVLIGIGLLLLMISFACAIGLGTITLIIPQPYTDYSIYGSSYFMGILLFSPLGGYALGRGLLLILRQSKS